MINKTLVLTSFFHLSFIFVFQKIANERGVGRKKDVDLRAETSLGETKIRKTEREERKENVMVIQLKTADHQLQPNVFNQTF